MWRCLPLAEHGMPPEQRPLLRSSADSAMICIANEQGYLPLTGPGAHAGSAISTRRFLARPSSVLLSATGLVLPYPCALSRAAVPPCLVSQSTTAPARA